MCNRKRFSVGAMDVVGFIEGAADVGTLVIVGAAVGAPSTQQSTNASASTKPLPSLPSMAGVFSDVMSAAVSYKQ